MLILNSLQATRIVEIIKRGGVVVMPTDTVYGLVANASEHSAVERLYDLKKREGKPGTIIAASVEQLADLGIKRRYVSAVQHLWPGALSVIVPSERSLKYLDQGKGSLAVRVVADRQLALLLEQTGPLLTTSANFPGKPSANTIEEAKKYFGDSVDAYINGGDLTGRVPSTIIRVVDDAIEILRLGAARINENGEII